MFDRDIGRGEIYGKFAKSTLNCARVILDASNK